MRCPQCGKDLRVMRTIETDRRGQKVARLRQCRDVKCGYTAYTYEVLPEYWDTVEGRAESISLIKRLKNFLPQFLQDRNI